jgi:hypothetical protein
MPSNRGPKPKRWNINAARELGSIAIEGLRPSFACRKGRTNQSPHIKLERDNGDTLTIAAL